jgi:hypothetical protein
VEAHGTNPWTVVRDYRQATQNSKELGFGEHEPRLGRQLAV